MQDVTIEIRALDGRPSMDPMTTLEQAALAALVNLWAENHLTELTCQPWSYTSPRSKDARSGEGITVYCPPGIDAKFVAARLRRIPGWDAKAMHAASGFWLWPTGEQS